MLLGSCINGSDISINVKIHILFIIIEKQNIYSISNNF